MTWHLDNPWGLVIVFSAFMIQVVAFGFSFAFGVYIVELLHQYDTSNWLLALIGSVNIGIFLGAGPLVSLLMRLLSYRKVALLGAVLSSIGMVSMPFTPNIELLLLFYGIITGFGFCMLYIPSHVLSGLYYEKHRSLATGVATAGSGLGSIIYPILVQHLINVYGWRGSMLILAGVNMNTLWLSGLLRAAPLQLDAEKDRETDIETKLISDNGDVTQQMSPGEMETSISNKETFVYFQKSDSQVTKEDEKAEFISKESQEKVPTNSEGSDTRKKSVVSEFVDVLKSFRFVIYFINNLMWNFGGVLVVLLAPDYFTHIGFTQNEASQIMSCIGIGSFLGCAIGGAVGNLPFINRIVMFILVCVAIGLEGLLFLQPFAHTYLILSLVGGVWGFTFGLILGLLVVVTADLVGVSALGDAMGILMLANGLGCITGPPVGGKLQDSLGNMESAFYLANALNGFSGLIMLLIPLYNRVMKRKRKE